MKRSSPLPLSAPLTRGKPLKRRKPIARSNKQRRAKLRAIQFGERAPAVRAMLCLCRQFGRWYEPGTWATNPGCTGEIEACHVRSRGAGGNRRDLVPLCSGHHQEQHKCGIKTFSIRYGLSLPEHAVRIARELDERGLP